MTKFHGSDFLDLEVEIQRELDALGNDDNFEVDNNFDEGDEIFLDSELQVSIAEEIHTREESCSLFITLS